MRAARANAASVACLVAGLDREGLVAGIVVPHRGAPGATAASAETTDGSGSYSIASSSAASFAWFSVSATINATGWPT